MNIFEFLNDKVNLKLLVEIKSNILNKYKNKFNYLSFDKLSKDERPL